MNPESLGEFSRRTKAGGTRKPLRTRAELAQEFGVKEKSLIALMFDDPEAPRPVFRSGGTRTSGTGTHRPSSVWYDPDTVRAWWKQRKEKNHE